MDDHHLHITLCQDTTNLTSPKLSSFNGSDSDQLTPELLSNLVACSATIIAAGQSISAIRSAIVATAKRLTGSDLCTLVIPVGKSKLKVVASTDEYYDSHLNPISKSLTGVCFRNRKSVRVADVRDHKQYFADSHTTLSELNVPMLDRTGAVIAVISAESNQVNHFKEAHEVALSILASQATSAYTAARVHHELNSVLATFSIVEAHSGHADISKVFSQIGESAMALVDGANQCQVMTIDGSDLVVEFSTDIDKRAITPGSVRMPMDRSISGLAIETKMSQRIGNIKKDPRAKERYLDLMLGMQSELAIPIFWQTRPLGVINLESSSRDAFSAHDEDILKLFAAQTAMAISSIEWIREKVWKDQVVAELWVQAAIGDTYGNLIHELTGDAGIVRTRIQRVRKKYAMLLSTTDGVFLDEQLGVMGIKIEKILELRNALTEKLTRARVIKLTNVNSLVLAVLNEPEFQVHGVEIIRRLDDNIGLIVCSEQLDDVIRNLVRNAIDALPEGGKIVVATSPWLTPSSSSQPVVGVRLEISDTCGGIPAPVAKKMWTPKFTTKKTQSEGLGFGLWWTRAFVERMQGKIEALPDTVVEGMNGCKFIVHLPTRSDRLESLTRELHNGRSSLYLQV